jgi:2-polyprenyl-3-methyl-5-hydroxy-6-metoxy-1,4-benzoquinol methylase
MLKMPGVNQPLTAEDESFCTQYELEIVSGIVNDNRLERWLPGFCNPQTNKEHVLRYDWVRDFVKNKIVLDIACGAGFGTYKLAAEGAAAKVTGYDIDEKTVRYASLRNRHGNIDFEVKNAESFYTGKQYDVIVSFETIEHLDKPGIFLKDINSALNDNGACFISTPISDVPENTHPDNVYHRREWGFRKFHEFVSGYLRVEKIFLQLYKIPMVSRGLISRLLRKTGFKKNIPSGIIEKLVPHQWDPQQLHEDLIGKVWIGYQVLQCSKKKDGRI